MRQVSSQEDRSSSWPVWIILIVLVATLVVLAAEERLKTSTIAHISGRLTLDGQPLQSGHSVVFMEPQRGDLAFGTTDSNGNFVVNSWKKGEMIPGRYKVYVVPPLVTGDANPDFRGDLEETLPARYPLEYRELRTTPLEYRVLVGENRFDIDLVTKDAAGAEPPDSASPRSSDGEQPLTP